MSRSKGCSKPARSPRRIVAQVWASGLPTVSRPGAQTVSLRFEDLRECRNDGRQLTRVYIVLPAARSRRFWAQLVAVLPPDSQRDRSQPAAIAQRDGNSDAEQDLVDVATEK